MEDLESAHPLIQIFESAPFHNLRNESLYKRTSGSRTVDCGKASVNSSSASRILPGHRNRLSTVRLRISPMNHWLEISQHTLQQFRKLQSSFESYNRHSQRSIPILRTRGVQLMLAIAVTPGSFIHLTYIRASEMPH